MSFTIKIPDGKPEKDPIPKLDRPKDISEDKFVIYDDHKAFKPLPNPRNKIEEKISSPNQKKKSKIEPHSFPPNFKPKNKIERPKLPPNHKPKNKIERLKLPPNHKPKNKILHHERSDPQPHLKPHNTSKNPKVEPNHKPSHTPSAETRKNVTQSKWAFINYDNNGNKISSEQKLQTAVEYFKKNILPELKKDPSIKQKIEEKQSLGINDLTRKGYSGFLNALSRDNKVNWSELKQTLGYTNTTHKVPTTEYKFMNYDNVNNPLNREQKLKVASDFYFKNILPDLKTKPEIKEKLEAGKGISNRDLEKYGYSKFHSALTRLGIHIKWNEFKEATDQKININQEKYRFINYDQNGNKLNQEQKMRVALEYYNNKLLPDLQKIPEIKKKLEKGEPPSIIDIRNHGFAGFIAPLCDKDPKINYNTLVKAAELEPNVDHDKYRILNYDANGNLIPYEQKLENAKLFLTDEIIPNLVDKNIIKPGQTPGVRELTKGGYSGFFPALAFRGDKIDYNDLVKNVGLKPNITQGRWDFIKYDQDGNILTKNEKLDIAVEYFSKNVYPDLVEKGIIKKGEPPSSLDLMDKNQDFLDALRGKEPKVSFNHFIEHAGFKPASFQSLSAIGRDFHWNAEKIFMEHTRNQNCKSFYEVNKNADNTILVNENFKNLSTNTHFFSHIRPDIRIINVDYYLGASQEHAQIHSNRGYQDEGKALFLVSIKANEPQPVDYQTPHHRNIFILDTDNFAQFMGFQGDTLNNFMETVDLAKKAIYDEDAREILNEKAVESIGVIKNEQNKLNYSTKEFDEYLKNN